MHILLTDVLTCPNCGPDFGLILLADRVENRRVLEGTLGCANCRERYRVEGGFADLRPPESSLEVGVREEDAEGRGRERRTAAAGEEVESGGSVGAAVEDAGFRLAALMGVTGGPGLVLVVGPGAEHARSISRVVEGVEIVAAGPGMLERPEGDGVSRVSLGRSLPFAGESMRAVVLGGNASDALLEGGAEVLETGGRLVLEDSPRDARARLEDAGFEIAAEEDRVLVAVKRGTPRPPKLYQLG